MKYKNQDRILNVKYSDILESMSGEVYEGRYACCFNTFDWWHADFDEELLLPFLAHVVADDQLRTKYQTSYTAWRRSCQNTYPGGTFYGDSDIAGYTFLGQQVGEWDGARGEVWRFKLELLGSNE